MTFRSIFLNRVPSKGVLTDLEFEALNSLDCCMPTLFILSMQMHFELSFLLCVVLQGTQHCFLNDQHAILECSV